MKNALLTAVTADEAQTQALAVRLAGACGLGDCILLKGDLGAGKTTFARGFIGALQQVRDDVVSPTFMLVQTYPTRAGWPIWHFDLYRVRDRKELEHLGLEEALMTGLTLIEWPDVAQEWLPSEALTVQIAYKDKNRREVTLCGDAPLWKQRLETMA